MRRQLSFVCCLLFLVSFVQAQSAALAAGTADGATNGGAGESSPAKAKGSKAKGRTKGKSGASLEPHWYGVTDGFEYARKRKKMIVCDFYTDWCGWCKVLDQTTYRDPAVLAAFKKYFVAIKVNAEDGGAGQEFADKVGIRGFPTIMFVSPNATPIYGFTGYRPAKKFIKILDAVIAGKSREAIDALDVPDPPPTDQDGAAPH